MQKKIIDFSRYSSIKIGPKIEVNIIENGDTIPKNSFIAGKACNLLISPTPPPISILGKDFDYIKEYDDILEVGASVATGRLLSYVKKNNIKGLEFISHLPGSIGGMVAMNAGVKEYEIFNILSSLKTDGRWIDTKDISHGYRYANLPGVVTAVRFKIQRGFDTRLQSTLSNLRKNQPKNPSAGSAFKNPKGEYAGKLIEAVGLKGKQIGGMAFSTIHANFLVNLGGGRYSEAIELIQLAKDRVEAKYGIRLEEEIKIVTL